MLMILTLPLVIIIAAAVVPAIVLLRYIYNKDKLDKESTSLIIKLVILGIISTVCAVLSESVGMGIINNVMNTNSPAYEIILNFIVIALSEEGFKYMVLKRATWKNPEFNCQFDAVVYSVAVSLGFALWENIQYVFRYGMGTALVRAVTAVPGHACFGVLMGAWYGMAKKYENLGYQDKAGKFRNRALIMPVIAHGAYDLFADMSSYWGSLVFIVLVAALFFICFNLVKALSESDSYISNDPDFSYRTISDDETGM